METRERIILKSFELFTRSGIRLVTMDQITTSPGMSRRTIYEIFKEKNEILWEGIETIFLIGQHGEKKEAGMNQ